jgi:hypothetical protein
MQPAKHDTHLRFRQMHAHVGISVAHSGISVRVPVVSMTAFVWMSQAASEAMPKYPNRQHVCVAA